MKLKALILLAWFVLLTGIAYPLFIAGIAQLTMSSKANGSLVRVGGRVVGSQLIGQPFSSENYFWPRPSAVDYSPLPSSGSNLGPTSRKLKALVEERRNRLAKTRGNQEDLPSELLFSSASGLDPHISVEAALFQAERIAAARKMDEKSLRRLIQSISSARLLGMFGEKYVNVLELNLAIDKLDQGERR